MDNAPQDAERRQLALKFWLAATAKDPTVSGRRVGEVAIDQLNTRGVAEVAAGIAGGSVGASQTGKTSREAARGVGFEDDGVVKGGPGSKMARLAARAEHLEQIQRLEARAAGRMFCAAANWVRNQWQLESGDEETSAS